MPIYKPRLNTLDTAETLRYAGMKQSKSLPEHLIVNACSEAQILAKPQAVWSIYTYDAANNIILSPQPITLAGQSITNHLTVAQTVAVLAVTIDDALEQAVKDKFAAGEYTAGLLLDAAGTAAVEMAADQVSEFLKVQSRKQGLTTLQRFSPGYGDWNITIQQQILTAAGGQQVGISCTESYMLIPRKSITAVIGFAADHNRLCTQKTSSCLCCTQHD